MAGVDHGDGEPVNHKPWNGVIRNGCASVRKRKKIPMGEWQPQLRSQAPKEACRWTSCLVARRMLGLPKNLTIVDHTTHAPVANEVARAYAYWTRLACVSAKNHSQDNQSARCGKVMISGP